MTEAVTIALIAAIPTTLVVITGAVGKTASYLIDLVQKKSDQAIEAKNTEIESYEKLGKIKDEIIEDLEERVQYLEGRMQKEGIDP